MGAGEAKATEESRKGTQSKSFVRSYLIKVFFIFVVSSAVALVERQFDPAALLRLNSAVRRSVESLNAWELSGVFYRTMFREKDFLGVEHFTLHHPLFALIETARRTWSEGAVSVVTAAIAFLIGVLLVLLSSYLLDDARKSGTKSEPPNWIFVLFLAPLFGSTFLWLALQILRVTLWALQAVVFFSVSIPLVPELVKAVRSEREHATAEWLAESARRPASEILRR